MTIQTIVILRNQSDHSKFHVGLFEADFDTVSDARLNNEIPPEECGWLTNDLRVVDFYTANHEEADNTIFDSLADATRALADYTSNLED